MACAFNQDKLSWWESPWQKSASSLLGSQEIYSEGDGLLGGRIELLTTFESLYVTSHVDTDQSDHIPLQLELSFQLLIFCCMNVPAIVTPAVRKRCRDPLAPTANEMRYQGVSQKKENYQKVRGLKDTVEKAVTRHFRAKHATACSHLLETKDTIQQR